MKDKLKKIFTDISGYGIIALIILAVVSALAIFGGAVMKLFGFEYNSIGSIILFFIVFAVIGFPAEVFAEALPVTLLELGKLSLTGARVLFVITDTTATVIAMTIADYFMESVSASDAAVFVLALLMSLSSVKDIKKRGRLT